MKRGASGLCGVLAINKPYGVTSHDVVNAVRRMTGEKRVGHAGTLDPMATGLMLVGVGAATRLSAYLTDHDKSYIARIVFGAATDTDDAEGRVVTSYTHKAPGEGLDALVSIDPAEELAAIEGENLQLPPAYSAIKKNGVTAYKAAREGKEIELEPRRVTIHSAKLLDTGFTEVDLNDGEGGRFASLLPYWDVELFVSKGTYIRAIARDLGQKLGCGAHLGALNRTTTKMNTECSSCVTLDDAFSLEELAQIKERGEELPWVDPVALLGYGVHQLTGDELAAVGNGKSLRVPASATSDEGYVCMCHGGKLHAIYKPENGCLKPEVVIPGGVVGVGSDEAGWVSLHGCLDDSKPTVLAIGVFDGLHLGHRALLGAAVEDARASKVQLAVITFSLDPDEVFGFKGDLADTKRFKLATNASRIDSLRRFLKREAGDLCADVVVIPAVKREFSRSAEEFTQCLQERFAVMSVHVGENFRYGKRAAGNIDTLRDWCAQSNIEPHVHPLVEAEGAPVSSTRIRELLAEGDVEQTARLRNGALHSVCGLIVHGRGEGTDMGFATANLEFKGPERSVVMPVEGVYACWALVSGSDEKPLVLPAAVNVGVAKSFEGATAEVEAHILGASGDFYGKSCTLWFVKHLRPQRKFDDVNELIATVTADINWVRENLVSFDGEVE